MKQQVDGGFGLVAASADVQRSQRMFLGKAVIEGFHQAGSGNGAGDEGCADRLEGRGRQRLAGEPGPETVAIAADGEEAGDLRVSNRVIDLSALVKSSAVVTAATEVCVRGTWPR